MNCQPSMMGMFRSTMIKSGSCSISLRRMRGSRTSMASLPSSKAFTSCAKSAICIIMRTPYTKTLSSSMIHALLIGFIKLHFKGGESVYLAFYTDAPIHGLDLVLHDEESDALGLRMSVKGLVHAKYLIAVTIQVYA